MKERPILFNANMVRAILEGRKTHTRRVIKPQPPEIWDTVHPVRNGSGTLLTWSFHNSADPDFHGYKKCPYGIPGDRLWVRETFQEWADVDGKMVPHYKADFPHGLPFDMNWRPSIHMPRWASRITLEITGVRVEQVQDITERDIIAEGITAAYPYNQFEKPTPDPNREGSLLKLANFKTLWDSIFAKRGFSWDANPWVWVIEFKVVHDNGR